MKKALTQVNEQRLESVTDIQNSSKPQTNSKSHRPKGINHLRTLQEIADKWVARGCYRDPGRALRALIGGDL